MEIKNTLLKLCEDFIDQRHQTITDSIREIELSLHSETKSSAGDKHETSRAMLHIEREKAGQQLAEIGKVKEALSKIETNKTHKTIAIGSVVYSSKSKYYIAISAGELKYNSEKFYAISPSTPIGRLLIGKTIGDQITFKNDRINIIKIL